MISMSRMKLTDIADIRAGYPFRGRIVNTPGADVHVVRMKNVEPDHGVDWSDLARTKLLGRRKPDFLEAGQILFLARGNHNFANCLDVVPVRSVCTPHFFLLDVLNDAETAPEFLAWQINQSPAQAYFRKSAEGSNSLSIRRGILEALPIVVPDMETQNKIVALNRTFLKEMSVMRRLMVNRRKMMDAIAREIL